MDYYLACAYLARDADGELQLFIDEFVVLLVAETVARKRRMSLIERERIFLARLQKLIDKLILTHVAEHALAGAVHIEHRKIERVEARLFEYFHALVNAESRENNVGLC